MISEQRESTPQITLDMDDLGCQLSIAIDCPIHNAAKGLPILICKCGVVFPMYLLKQGNWANIRRKHNTEKGLIDGVYI